MQSSLNLEVKQNHDMEDTDDEPPSRYSPIIANSYPPSVSSFINLSNTLISSIISKKTKSKILPVTYKFRKKFFPTISKTKWNDWHWQISNRICSLEQLKRFIKVSPEEESIFKQINSRLPVSITPYYMSLLSPDEPEHPLRRTVVPTIHELFKSPEEKDDPLGEEHQSPVPGLVHRYPDRVLFLILDFCSTYCRYCTRSRVVGRGSILPARSRLEKAIEYIKNNPSIRDVLISGGDPLTLSDNRLEWLLIRLRQIPHVEIIRIGTKVPAVLPQRITPNLVKILRKYHPLWMSLHFTHPEECTPEAYRACNMLANAGIPLGSQTVLLKGINDDVPTMKNLMHHLLKMRVRPYYLYQCDLITGSSHFRTSIDKGLEIIQGLRGYTSGYAVPNYVIDAPGGGGKIPLMPDYVTRREGHDLLLKNYEDRIFRYTDTVSCH
ncbi:MAG: KamA family radical SAM protein [Proteobacteria bacterium]|nr:KamA family radical SAM protein [Pseudomonadota bacterium]